MRNVLLGIGLWLSLAVQAAAAPVVYVFSGVITATNTFHTIDDVGGRSVEIGGAIAGGYSYELNPANPDQTINNRFWFSAGTLVRDIENLLLLPDGTIASQVDFRPDARPDLSYVEFMTLDPSNLFTFRFQGHYGIFDFTATMSERREVPGPGALALLALGVAGLVATRRGAGRCERV